MVVGLFARCVTVSAVVATGMATVLVRTVIDCVWRTLTSRVVSGVGISVLLELIGEAVRMCCLSLARGFRVSVWRKLLMLRLTVVPLRGVRLVRWRCPVRIGMRWFLWLC